MRRESHTRHTKSHAQNVHNLGTAQRAATASQPGRARVAQRHVAARLQPRVDAPVEADAALIRLIRGVALLVARGGRGQHDGPQVPGAVEIAERMPDRPLSAHAAAEGGLPGVCMHRQSRASCGERKASREHLQDSRVRVFASGSRNAGASTPHLRNGRPPTRRAAYSKRPPTPGLPRRHPPPFRRAARCLPAVLDSVAVVLLPKQGRSNGRAVCCCPSSGEPLLRDAPCRGERAALVPLG